MGSTSIKICTPIVTQEIKKASTNYPEILAFVKRKQKYSHVHKLFSKRSKKVKHFLLTIRPKGLYQINYVMSTRFSPEHGYIVESRRGGGGYIRITRVRMDRQELLMHIIGSIGDELDSHSARALLTNLVQSEALERTAAQTALWATSDTALRAVPKEHRDRVKTLAKGATSRKIAIAVRRTFVKSSIIKALAESIRTYRK